ncbi:MAG: hypothetical protein KKF77_13480 [Proteobacteria bacterium]|nr:hypothetical protein [Pseudomonadota bacterium]
MLGIISNEEMLEFVQKHNLNKYISDIELIHSDLSNTNGKLDTLPSSFLLKYDGIHRLIGQHRVFFRKDDIEALQEKYSINSGVANDDYAAAELQRCRLELRSMTDEKDKLVNRLKRETGLRTAANAQAAERKQSNHLERVRILLAMKVAIRLTKSYDDKVPYTRRRIREALADELGPGKEFEALGGEFEKELKTKLEMKPRKKAHGSLVDEPGPEKKLEMLWEKLENKLEKSVPNFLVELVRDGLPGMVKQEKGAPLKII